MILMVCTGNTCRSPMAEAVYNFLAKKFVRVNLDTLKTRYQEKLLIEDCIKQGKPMPIDVYDMATWMAITILSEQSIMTGQAMPFPDFTNGAWIKRKNEFAKV